MSLFEQARAIAQTNAECQRMTDEGWHLRGFTRLSEPFGYNPGGGSFMSLGDETKVTVEDFDFYYTQWRPVTQPNMEALR